MGRNDTLIYVRCPICDGRLGVRRTYVHEGGVERDRQCDSCPFRAKTVEIIFSTKSFKRAFRKAIKQHATSAES